MTHPTDQNDMRSQIIRVQDREGRGPWRAGLSRLWVDEDGPAGPPPIFQEVRGFQRIVDRAHRDGMHIGCATRLHRFPMWFRPLEIAKLQKLGFHVCDVSTAKILAETETQVLIGVQRAFHTYPMVAWPPAELVTV